MDGDFSYSSLFAAAPKHWKLNKDQTSNSIASLWEISPKFSILSTSSILIEREELPETDSNCRLNSTKSLVSCFSFTFTPLPFNKHFSNCTYCCSWDKKFFKSLPNLGVSLSCECIYPLVLDYLYTWFLWAPWGTCPCFMLFYVRWWNKERLEDTMKLRRNKGTNTVD